MKAANPISYNFLDVFAGMLNNENSYIRTRGIVLIALHGADITRYKTSMQPLVLKDIQTCLNDIQLN